MQIECPNCDHRTEVHGWKGCEEKKCECPLNHDKARMAVAVYAATRKANYDAR